MLVEIYNCLGLSPRRVHIGRPLSFYLRRDKTLCTFVPSDLRAIASKISWCPGYMALGPQPPGKNSLCLRIVASPWHLHGRPKPSPLPALLPSRPHRTMTACGLGLVMSTSPATRTQSPTCPGHGSASTSRPRASNLICLDLSPALPPLDHRTPDASVQPGRLSYRYTSLSHPHADATGEVGNQNHRSSWSRGCHPLSLCLAAGPSRRRRLMRSTSLPPSRICFNV
jgi:hypothetical protein